GSENVSPQEEIIKNEEQENLKNAVLQLSPSLRQVLLLILEGLSNKEISDVLGISENNVAVRFLRAKKILSEILEP
ncbi:MAG TPA: sigma-70 family RNA polymerase sigma factor, partial [Balneolaceae bacterium]|nr:sigma-70 family RNA polymerase sigma factor [Balneolaceae bacterium]